MWEEDDPNNAEIWIQCDVCGTWPHVSCAGYTSDDNLHEDT